MYEHAGSRIGRTLLLYILLVSSLITLVLTAVQLYRDYTIDLNLIDQRLTQIEISNLPGLTEQLWKVDHAVLQLQLEGIAKLTDVRSIQVLDAGRKVVAYAGLSDVGEGARIARTYAMQYPHGERVVTIGELRVSADLQAVYDRLLSKATVILLSQGVKTFVVSAFILFLVAQLVTRRLVSLATAARRFSVDDASSWFRHRDTSEQSNEIDDLTHAMYDMQQGLVSAFTLRKQLEERFRKIYEGSNDMIFLVDVQNNCIVDCNRRAEAMLMYDRYQMRGMDLDALYPDQQVELADFLERVEIGHLGTTENLSCLRADNTRMPVEVSASTIDIDGKDLVLAMVRDHTARKKAEDRIAYLAYHDSLTDLPNRALLRDRLSVALARAMRFEQRGVVLFLDLDNFKTVNDSLGHTTGDLLLQQFASRLSTVVRGDDTFARVGGDEFVIVLDSAAADRVAVLEEVESFVGLLNGRLKEPFSLANKPVHVSVSIGIAIYPDDGTSVDKILRRADSAMYQAKSEGRDGACFFSPHLEEGASRRLALQASLRSALEREEFILDMQSQVNLEDGSISAAEALIRWREPGCGVTGPDQFIPFLEESGLIVPVGNWVLRSACRYWQEQLQVGTFPTDARIAVNVSPVELKNEDYCKSVAQALIDSGLPPENLELELTEQVVIHGFDQQVEKLQQLRIMGVSLAIDDFGTGYSSLSYLHRLPVQTIKIDRSFVNRMNESEHDAALIDSIIAMARKLGLRVVAEGVETQEQAERLHAFGCERAQGYYFARPVTVVDSNMDKEKFAC